MAIVYWLDRVLSCRAGSAPEYLVSGAALSVGDSAWPGPIQTRTIFSADYAGKQILLKELELTTKHTRQTRKRNSCAKRWSVAVGVH